MTPKEEHTHIHAICECGAEIVKVPNAPIEAWALVSNGREVCTNNHWHKPASAAEKIEPAPAENPCLCGTDPEYGMQIVVPECPTHGKQSESPVAECKHEFVCQWDEQQCDQACRMEHECKHCHKTRKQSESLAADEFKFYRMPEEEFAKMKAGLPPLAATQEKFDTLRVIVQSARAEIADLREEVQGRKDQISDLFEVHEEDQKEIAQLRGQFMK